MYGYTTLQRTYVLVESAVLENEVEQLPHPYLSLSEFLLQHEKSNNNENENKDENEDEDENENEDDNENEDENENDNENQNENQNQNENGRGDPAQERVSKRRVSEATTREEEDKDFTSNGWRT